MAAINVLKKRSDPILAVRNKYAVDYWLLLAIGALATFGFLMVYSTTFDLGVLYKENAAYYITRQLVAMGLGISFILVFMQFDYHVLRYFSVPFLFLTIGLLTFVLIFGRADFGATRALSEGSYQPSELAKLTVILYIAHWLQSKGDRIKQINYGLLPFSLITGFMFFLIATQPALSTATLVALISVTLFFVAGADLKQVLVVVLVASGFALFLMFTYSHASARVDNFLATLRDPNQAGYQVKQALGALANGGYFGVGLGEGTQKFGPLPLAHTDGVFAIVGEELGLLGTMTCMALFVLLAWRGFRAATRARDTYGFLLAVGVTVWVSYQALVNVAVITASMPFTGMPMPFFSYGGSSMLATLVGMGILLNISRDGAIGRVPRAQRSARQQQD